MNWGRYLDEVIDDLGEMPFELPRGEPSVVPEKLVIVIKTVVDLNMSFYSILQYQHRTQIAVGDKGAHDSS